MNFYLTLHAPLSESLIIRLDSDYEMAITKKIYCNQVNGNDDESDKLIKAYDHLITVQSKFSISNICNFVFQKLTSYKQLFVFKPILLLAGRSPMLSLNTKSKSFSIQRQARKKNSVWPKIDILSKSEQAHEYEFTEPDELIYIKVKKHTIHKFTFSSDIEEQFSLELHFRKI